MPETYCRECGAIVQPTDLFCRRCGFPLGTTASTEKGSQFLKLEQRKGKLPGGGFRSALKSLRSKRTIYQIAAVCLLFLVLALVEIFFIPLAYQAGGMPHIAIGIVGTSTPYPKPAIYSTSTIYPTVAFYPTTGILGQQTEVNHILNFDHQCQLIVKNLNTHLDSVVILSDVDTNAIVVAVYVRARDSFTYTGITTGTYHTYIALGLDWDNLASRFKNDVLYLRFKGTDTFTHCSSLDTYFGYQSLEITLNSTEGSGSDIVNVQPDSFPIISP